MLLAEPDEPLPAVSPRRRQKPILAVVLVVLLVLAIGGVLGLREYFRAVEAHLRREACAAQLHKIGVALQNYADEHSVYPPAIVRDAQGKPLHSWRVLILPQLGQDEEKLHKEYRYDEPWDGPHNRELATRMPAVYRCPEDPGALDAHTSYLALVDGTTGDFAAYPTGGSNAPPKKPPLTAYLLIEVAESGINWMEPKDIALGASSQPAQPLPIDLSYHVGGSLAVDTDGATIVLARDEMEEAISAKPSVPAAVTPKGSNNPARGNAPGERTD